MKGHLLWEWKPQVRTEGMGVSQCGLPGPKQKEGLLASEISLLG